jgi:hypothetical protein
MTLAARMGAVALATTLLMVRLALLAAELEAFLSLTAARCMLAGFAF